MDSDNSMESFCRHPTGAYFHATWRMAMVMVVLPICRGHCATRRSKLGPWKAILQTCSYLPQSWHSADTRPGHGSYQSAPKTSDFVSQL